MFFKLSNLFIFLIQMIKRNSKVVKTSAFDFEIVIFFCPWIYDNIVYEYVIVTIYFNSYQKLGLRSKIRLSKYSENSKYIFLKLAILLGKCWKIHVFVFIYHTKVHVFSFWLNCWKHIFFYLSFSNWKEIGLNMVIWGVNFG